MRSWVVGSTVVACRFRNSSTRSRGEWVSAGDPGRVDVHERCEVQAVALGAAGVGVGKDQLDRGLDLDIERFDGDRREDGHDAPPVA